MTAFCAKNLTMFADFDKHVKMNVFPSVIYSVLLVMCIVCLCNGDGDGDRGTRRCLLDKCKKTSVL